MEQCKKEMAQNLTNAGWLMDINKLDFPSHNCSVI